MPFNPITDTHLFPDEIKVGDSVEISIKVNGGQIKTYTKEITEAPETNGRLYVKLIIQEGE